MFLTVTALFLVAISSPVPASGDGDCKFPPAVEKFAAAFFTAMFVSTDRNVTNHLKISGGHAGMIIHDEIKNVLEEHKQCNAEEVAFVAGRAASIEKIVNLKNYFMKSAYTMARALYEFGILDCDNAIPLALKWFGYVQDEKKGMDKESFVSYAHGITYGVVDLYLYLGVRLSDVTQKTANFFYLSFAEDKPTCPFANNSSGENNKPQDGDVNTTTV